MASAWRTVLITALIAFVAGALGVYAGFSYLADRAPREHASLDAVVHRELGLSAMQTRKIETTEARFAARKASLEAEMRAATREIAISVSEDKTYTPRVEHAVERFHKAMGELQHGTILHVFEMRAVLTPSQQNRFDETVRTELLRAAEEPQPD